VVITDARLRRRLVLIVSLVLAGLLTHGTYAGSGDEPHYLAIAHSLAFDFDLDLSNNYGASEPLIADGKLDPERHTPRGIDGVPRPVHDIGMPLAFAPYVRIARPAASWIARRLSPAMMARLRVTPTVLYRHTISAGMIVAAVCLAVLMFDVFVLSGSTPRTAFWGSLLISLSPPLLILSILFFTEVLSALLCLWVFREVVLEPRDRAARWMVAGGAAGFLLLIHIRNIGIVLVLMILAVMRLRPARVVERLGFILPIAVLVAARTVLNYRSWGSLVTGPHAHAGEWPGLAETTRIAATRFAGLLLDQEFGLLVYAPLFVLAAAGFVVLARSRPAIPRAALAIISCYLLTIILPMTNVQGWTGGWSPAARFLAPIVPLLGIAVAAAMPVLPRSLLVVIIALQIVIDAYAWQHPKNLWNDGDGVAAACARGGVPVCRYLPSFTGRYR
jgi:hypothetical protein